MSRVVVGSVFVGVVILLTARERLFKMARSVPSSWPPVLRAPVDDRGEVA